MLEVERLETARPFRLTLAFPTTDSPALSPVRILLSMNRMRNAGLQPA